MPIRAAMLLTLTMAPEPRAIMPGANAAVSR